MSQLLVKLPFLQIALQLFKMKFDLNGICGCFPRNKCLRSLCASDRAVFEFKLVVFLILLKSGISFVVLTVAQLSALYSHARKRCGLKMNQNALHYVSILFFKTSIQYF